MVAIPTTVCLVAKVSEPLTLVKHNSPFHVLWCLCFLLGFLVKVQPEMAYWVSAGNSIHYCSMNAGAISSKLQKMVWENTVQLVMAKYIIFGTQSM